MLYYKRRSRPRRGIYLGIDHANIVLIAKSTHIVYRLRMEADPHGLVRTRSCTRDPRRSVCVVVHEALDLVISDVCAVHASVERGTALRCQALAPIGAAVLPDLTSRWLAD